MKIMVLKITKHPIYNTSMLYIGKEMCYFVFVLFCFCFVFCLFVCLFVLLLFFCFCSVCLFVLDFFSA